MADHSKAESSKSHNFGFKIQEAKIFKNAIFALTDPEFNPNTTAVFDVSPTGDSFIITVRRPAAPNFNQFDEHIVYATLHLQGTRLGDYECIAPLRKTVNLSPLSESLAHVSDNDAVTVYHLFNTPDILYFEFGSEPNNNPIELNLNDESFGPLKFPDGIFLESKTVAASKDLEAMVESILNLAPEHRPYSVTVNETCLEAGPFEVEAETVDGPFSFFWRYWGMLRKALSSAEKCCICLLTVPDKNMSSIMVEFNSGDIGDLRLLHGEIVLHDN